MEGAGDNALERLYRGLRQRELIAGDDRGRAALEARLVPLLRTTAEALCPAPAPPLERPPARRVAIAMALALASHAHLTQTFDATGDLPIVYGNDVLEPALGLAGWELDDLREEVDRRAGTMLRQRTLVTHLATMPPARVASQLFPGTTLGEVEVRATGSHLLVLADAPTAGPSSLHLRWLGTQGTGPTDAFLARYVDANLKRSLRRALGCDPTGIDELLERSVLFLPRADASQLLPLERWRLAGFATLTQIGLPGPGPTALSRNSDSQVARWREWLRADDLDRATRALDALLQPRVHAMLRALHADLLARAQPDAPSSDGRLDLFDLARHLDAVGRPLLLWASSRSSATDVARALAVEQADAEAMLVQVHRMWRTRLDTWARPEPDQLHAHPQGRWSRQLLTFEHTLRELAAREPVGPPHRDLLHLFAGHLLAEAPLQRALLEVDAPLPGPGETIARWFWPTWQRVVAMAGELSGSTQSGFLVPDDLF